MRYGPQLVRGGAAKPTIAALEIAKRISNYPETTDTVGDPVDLIINGEG